MRVFSIMSASLASSLSAEISDFFVATNARSCLKAPSSPRAFAAPTSFAALFASAWAVSAAKILLRRTSSKVNTCDETGAMPRRDREASKAAGLSRIIRISCICRVL